MASDIEKSYWPSTSAEPGARLCNFATNESTLRPAHQQWLLRNIVPLLSGHGSYIVEIGGLASRLGPAAYNKRLGQARADAAKKFLEQQVKMSLPHVLTASYGENVSGGGVNNNDGYWRAVLVKLHQGVDLPDPPPKVERPTMPKVVPKMYFGFGVKYGGALAIGGKQAVDGWLFSADDYHDRVFVQAEIFTAGPGLGAGTNVVFVIATGGPDKHAFRGTKFTGWDFAVSLGGRWGDALKTARRVPTIRKLSKVLKESGSKALKEGGKLEQIVERAAKMSPEDWEKLADSVKRARDALGVDLNATKPQVNVFDVPFAGAALEVSLYKYWGEVTIFR
ncbi:MAG: OmpA family protein [Hyphomicrobiales bacterium]